MNILLPMRPVVDHNVGNAVLFENLQQKVRIGLTADEYLDLRLGILRLGIDVDAADARRRPEIGLPELQRSAPPERRSPAPSPADPRSPTNGAHRSENNATTSRKAGPHDSEKVARASWIGLSVNARTDCRIDFG